MNRPPLVKLPDGSYVNPEHVVLINFAQLHVADGGPITQVFTLNRSAYVALPGDQRDELAALFQS